VDSNAGEQSQSADSASRTKRLFKEIIPDATEFARAEDRNESKNKAVAQSLPVAETPILVFPGGRGVAQLADLGRGNALSAPPDVFQQPDDKQ
jgi:hypothetical protein